MKRYEILRFQPSLRSQVVDLLAPTFGPDAQLNEAYLDWKYCRNPYLGGGAPLIYLALHDGGVVGMRCLYGSKWQVEPDEPAVVIPCHGDTYIVPEHRNFGLFKDITLALVDDVAKSGHRFLLNFSAGPGTFVSSRMLGWRSLAPYDSLRRTGLRRGLMRRVYRQVRKLPVIATARAMLGSAAAPPAAITSPARHAFAGLDRRSARRGPGPGRPIVVEPLPRARAMAELIARLPWDGRIRQARDEAFLTWRFAGPHYIYRFVFWGDDPLEGYMALQTDPRYGPSAAVRILDWVGVSAEVEVGLLRAALDWGGFDECLTWSATLSPGAKAALESQGFAPFDDTDGIKGFRRALLVRAVDSKQPPESWSLGDRPLLDIASWDLRLLYADGC